jgi:hypothetical protein
MLGTIRLPLVFVAAIALAAPATAAPAPTVGKNVIFPYPAKVPLVVQVNGFERARERLGKMLEALPPAEAKLVKEHLESGLKKALTGRSLSAVPKDGRLFLVVHDFSKLGDDEPALSVLVPVTSYKDFKASALTTAERKTAEKAGEGVESIKSAASGEEVTLYLVDLKEYVAISPSKETAQEYTGKYTRAESSAMGDDLGASFLAADVALTVNMDVINDKYGDQIRQFKGLIDFALGQAQMGGMIPGLNKKQIDMVKVVLNGFVQAIEDAQGVVIAAEFRPEGLNLRGQVQFASDSPSDKMLKPETPTPLANLAKLPRGLNTYGGSKFGKKFADLTRQFAQEFAAGDDDEKGAKQVEKLLAEVAAAGPQGEFAAGSPPDLAMTVTAYQNPTQAIAALTKLYQGLPASGRFANMVLKEKPKVTESAQTYRGFTFTEVRLTLDFAATVESLPENVREMTLNSLKRVLKEKTVFWIGTDGKVVTQLTAKDWEAAKKLLDEYLDGKTVIGSVAGFQVTRKNLPDDATAVSLFETGQMLIMLIEQVKTAAAAFPGGLPAIGTPKAVKGDPTYVGMAITLKPRVATVDGFLPGSAMNVATKMLLPLFQNIE